MTTVFIAGAGFIGSAVAIALREVGYHVTVMVRTASKAADLIKHEIRVIEGDVRNPSSYEHELQHASYVIDFTANPAIDGVSDKPSTVTLLELVEKYSERFPKSKTFIYTSGIFVYGSNPDKVLDESSPQAENLHPWAVKRFEIEQRVLNSKVRGVVLRPGWVYGLSSGIFGHIVFGSALKGQIEFAGNVKNQISYIHVSDLADAYRRVVDAPASVVESQVFNVVGSSHPTNEQVYSAAANIAGFTGEIKVRQPSNDWENFANCHVVCSPLKAMRLLNWTPRHLEFLADVEVLFKAYKASSMEFISNIGSTRPSPHALHIVLSHINRNYRYFVKRSIYSPIYRRITGTLLDRDLECCNYCSLLFRKHQY